MNPLAEEDKAILDRLDLPPEQRSLIETHWHFQEPKSRKKTRFFAGWDFIMPSIVVILLCGHFVEGITFLVNITILVICFFAFAGFIGFAGLAGNAFYLMVSKDVKKNKRLLDRYYIAAFTKQPKFIRYRNRLTWLAFVLLTASLGHIIISFLLVVAWLLTLPLNIVVKVAIKVNLDNLTKQSKSGFQEDPPEITPGD